MRAYIALLEGSSPDDVVCLQLKQARRSLIARFVHGDAAWHDHQGMRVVEYQQALQTVSDPLLGWASTGHGPHAAPRPIGRGPGPQVRRSAWQAEASGENVVPMPRGRRIAAFWPRRPEDRDADPAPFPVPAVAGGPAPDGVCDAAG